MLKQILAICLVAFCLATASAQELLDSLNDPKAHGQALDALTEKANEALKQIPKADGDNAESPPPAEVLTVKNNLRQIALAMHSFNSAILAFPARYNKASDGRPLLSWRVHILPFMDELKLYKKFKLDEPWNSPHNKKLIKEMPEIYGKGSRGYGKEGQTRLVAIDHLASALMPPSRPDSTTGRKLSLNGTSNTVLVIENKVGETVTWTQPVDLNVDLDNPLKDAWGEDEKITCAFCDASVRELTKDEFESSEVLTVFTDRELARDGELPNSDENAQRLDTQRFNRNSQQVADGGYGGDLPASVLANPPDHPDWKRSVREFQARDTNQPFAPDYAPRDTTNLQMKIVTLQRKAENATDEDSREDILLQLQETLEKSFDDSLKAQATELERLENRVDELRAAWAKRKSSRDRVIENYVDRIRLQAEGLTIPGAVAPRPTLLQPQPAFAGPAPPTAFTPGARNTSPATQRRSLIQRGFLPPVAPPKTNEFFSPQLPQSSPPPPQRNSNR